MNTSLTRRWRIVAALLLLALLAPWPAFGVARAADAAYRLTDLGGLNPLAINAVGQVAGEGRDGHAVIWRDGATDELTRQISRAYGLNDRGWAVGSTAENPKDDPRAVPRPAGYTGTHRLAQPRAERHATARPAADGWRRVGT